MKISRDPKRPGLVLLAAVCACVSAAATPAATPAAYGRYYVDQLYIGNQIESQGGYYQGRKVPVDNAYCLGLRRFGVRTGGYGLDRFWRFKCTLSGADGHTYEAQVSTTHGPAARNVYWHFLSSRRVF